RGIKKSEARIDEWAKDLAPTTALRTAYNHQPEYWEVFQQQYYAELLNNPLTHHFLDKWENEKQLTLLYSSKDPRYSHAHVLKKFLDMQYISRYAQQTLHLSAALTISFSNNMFNLICYMIFKFYCL